MRRFLLAAAILLCAMSPTERVAILSGPPTFPRLPTVAIRAIGDGTVYSPTTSGPTIGASPFSIQAFIKPAGLTSSLNLIIVSRYTSSASTSNSQFILEQTTTGNLELGWYSSDSNFVGAPSTVPLPSWAVTQGIWVRADGFPATSIENYYISSDGKHWRLLGNPVSSSAHSGQTANPSSQSINVLNFSGSIVDGRTFLGSVYEIKIIIGGAVYTDAKFYDATPGSSTYTDQYGMLWTVFSSSTGDVVFK
jgi:hypothetical protein